MSDDRGPREWTLVVRGDPRDQSWWTWEVLGPRPNAFHDDVSVTESNVIVWLKQDCDTLTKQLTAMIEQRDSLRSSLESMRIFKDQIEKEQVQSLREVTASRDKWKARSDLNGDRAMLSHEAFEALQNKTEKLLAALGKICASYGNGGHMAGVAEALADYAQRPTN